MFGQTKSSAAQNTEKGSEPYTLETVLAGSDGNHDEIYWSTVSALLRQCFSVAGGTVQLEADTERLA